LLEPIPALSFIDIAASRAAQPALGGVAAPPPARTDWLVGAVDKRLWEEFGKLQVEINDEKSRIVDLERGESFGFLGFDFRYPRSRRGAWRPQR
jgi:hypothetical protein